MVVVVEVVVVVVVVLFLVLVLVLVAVGSGHASALKQATMQTWLDFAHLSCRPCVYLLCSQSRTTRNPRP